MAVFKCKMCGGMLAETSETTAVCEYCGTKQTLPKTNNEIVSNLYNRANNLRLKCEFDKAEQAYEKILEVDNTEAEAHWGIVLCKYGIEYVEDPVTYTRVPTCHRTSFDVILTDDSYRSAVSNADSAQKVIYEDEANKINVIQHNILEVVKKEKPFDVFICYKETDENGNRTIDSVIANDIYHQLVNDGFKVFYSAITLEDKLGQEYEPYIFAALNSAKVMLAIGTKPEYFYSVWVKNEWSRYLKILKNDRSKMLIPCYKNMDAYDLPEEFSHLQAQDMGKIGFINDIERGIKKLLQKDKVDAVPVVEQINTNSVNVEVLLKRVFIFLEDGNFESANEYCEKVLDADPENARAYLGKLMVELRVRNQEQFVNLQNSFEKNNNFQKIIRYADETLKSEMVGYINAIHMRKREELYVKTIQRFEVASKNNELINIAEVFKSLGDYKDSKKIADACLEKAETIRKEGFYSQARRDMSVDAIFFYKRALEHFSNIPGWRDTDSCVEFCKKRIEEISIMEEKNRAKRLADYKKKKLIRKIVGTSVCLITILLIIALLSEFIFEPISQYDEANRLMADGKYSDAKIIYQDLGNYKNSREKLEECNVELTLSSLEVGDVIDFGRNTEYPNESISWRVLAIEDDRALIISENVVETDCYSYYYSSDVVYWGNSSIRSYLNSDFLESFTDYEKGNISLTQIYKNNMINSNEYTADEVFLLSIAEAERYFTSNEDRTCRSADGYYDYCNWWLRTPGESYECLSAAVVTAEGVISYAGCDISDYSIGVRPAMWVEINN